MDSWCEERWNHGDHYQPCPLTILMAKDAAFRVRTASSDWKEIWRVWIREGNLRSKYVDAVHYR